MVDFFHRFCLQSDDMDRIDNYLDSLKARHPAGFGDPEPMGSYYTSRWLMCPYTDF